MGTSTITSSKTARDIGVMLNDQLNFSDHISKTARSFIFALFNIKKRSGPFFQNMLQNSLFKLLFCPDWTIAQSNRSWLVFQTVLSNL